MSDVVAHAVAEGFTHIAFADLFLEDVRRYREERLAGTGLTPIFPLFGALQERWADEGLHRESGGAVVRSTRAVRRAGRQPPIRATPLSSAAVAGRAR
jgi:hypothetical protein